MLILDRCNEAACLLANYKAALTAFDASQALHHQAPEHMTSREVAGAKQDAYNVLLRARRKYWNHLSAHACRRVVLQRSSHVPSVPARISISIHG